MVSLPSLRGASHQPADESLRVWPRLALAALVVLLTLALLTITRFAVMQRLLREEAAITHAIATVAALRDGGERVLRQQERALHPRGPASVPPGTDSLLAEIGSLDSVRTSFLASSALPEEGRRGVDEARAASELVLRLARSQLEASVRGDSAAARRQLAVSRGITVAVRYKFDDAIRTLVGVSAARIHGVSRFAAIAVAVTLLLLVSLGRWIVLPAIREASRAYAAADRARTELRAQAADLATAAVIVKSTSDGIVSCDHALRVTEWNPTMERWTTIPRALALGRSVDEVLPVPDPVARRDCLLDCMRSRQPYERSRAYVVPATGVELVVDTTVVPIVASTGDAVTGVLCTIRDVGERTAAVRAVRESEARTQAVVHNAAHVIVGMRPDFTVFEWNAAAERAFQVTRGEAIGRNFVTDLLACGWRDTARDELERVLRGESVHGFTTEIVDPTRGGAVIDWHATRVDDGSGGASGIVAVGNDVTDVRAADERFRVLFDANADGHLLFDAHGILDCNRATLRLLGATEKSQVVGRHPALFSPDVQPNGRDSMELGDEMIARAVAQGAHRFEWMHRALDGTPLPMEVMLTRVRIDGRGAILCVWHDLRERDAAELAVRRERARLVEAIDVLDSAFMMFDREERLVIANSQARHLGPHGADDVILGTTLEEILRRMLVDGRHPVTAEDGESWVVRSVARHRGEACRFEEDLGVPMRGSVARLSDGGSAVLLTDISTHKEIQASLERARDEARDANRAKSEFLARMSHELRTPLNSIIGFSRQVTRTSGERLLELERTYLERVTHNGVQLLAIINDILDLSKIEAGRMDVDLAPTDVGQLVHETVALLEGQPRRPEVEVRAEVPDGLELLVTDGAQLRQVLINLVGNALKFTHSGTVLVRVTGCAGGRPVAIDVVDTGIGIAADRQAAVFEAFEQAEATTTRRYGGTGLGLSICRAICTQLGMTLTLTSTVGQGSTFTIQLPSAA